MHKFYKEKDLSPDAKLPFELRKRSEEEKVEEPKVPVQSGLYKRNVAAFFGDKQDDRASSRGSVLQKNAAHFYGYETPAYGERPFEMPPKEPTEEPKANPVLAQRQVRTLRYKPAIDAKPP